VLLDGFGLEGSVFHRTYVSVPFPAKERHRKPHGPTSFALNNRSHSLNRRSFVHDLRKGRGNATASDMIIKLVS
jgi:hypothetical protein